MLLRRAGPESLIALDRLTLQAVTEGKISLEDGREIHAAIWIRALRCLIDELIRPRYALDGRSAKEVIAKAWRLAMRPLHDDLNMSPFKMTPAKVRLAQAAMGKPKTNVADLCAELGITRQTLYRFVGPKGELGADGERLLKRRTRK
ncbi:DNA-invertase (plasmid) [Sinorhizobium fredii CCBAU 83666]|nr:DNA-invertase [Sinorhizobium fredii CCBAU 83666]